MCHLKIKLMKRLITLRQARYSSWSLSSHIHNPEGQSTTETEHYLLHGAVMLNLDPLKVVQGGTN